MENHKGFLPALSLGVELVGGVASLQPQKRPSGTDIEFAVGDLCFTGMG